MLDKRRSHVSATRCYDADSCDVPHRMGRHLLAIVGRLPTYRHRLARVVVAGISSVPGDLDDSVVVRAPWLRRLF